MTKVGSTAHRSLMPARNQHCPSHPLDSPLYELANAHDPDERLETPDEGHAMLPGARF